MTLERIRKIATATPFIVPSVLVAGAHSSVNVDVERTSRQFPLIGEECAFDVNVPAQTGLGNTRAIRHGGRTPIEGNGEFPTSAAR